MQRISLRALLQAGVITNISNLRVNASGYPYVTFLGKPDLKGNATSTNVYFSVNAAKAIGANHGIGDNILKSLVEADVVFVQNSKKEDRYKISLPSDKSQYATENELNKMFELEPKENTEFDVKTFALEFTAAPATPAAEGDGTPELRLQSNAGGQSGAAGNKAPAKTT